MRLLFPLLLAIALLSLSSGGRAQSANRDRDEYNEAVNLGLTEFEEKNFLEARVHFARAHAIDPSARTLRALGMVYFELKDYVQSVAMLNGALSSHDRPLEAEKREQTQKLLARANAYIARITLDIEPHTQVAVDGKATNLSAGSELVLGVGEHNVEFRAPGRITDKRTIKVQGGENETLRVQLATLRPVPSDPGAPRADSAPKERPVYKSPWLWTAVGIVVAGAAAGAAVALTQKTETRSEEPNLGTSGEPPLIGLMR